MDGVGALQPLIIVGLLVVLVGIIILYRSTNNKKNKDK